MNMDMSKLITKEMKNAKAAKDEQDSINREARAFLAASDYKVIKELERILADQIDPAALVGRQAARDSVVEEEINE